MEQINFDNHFRDLFENTSDMVQFLDIDGTIEIVNPAWLKTLNYELLDVTGRSIYDFVHPDYLETYKANRNDAIINNKLKYFEIAFVTRGYETVIGEAQVGCSYKDGKPSYTRCVFKDVTLKKRAEQEMEQGEQRLKAFFDSAPDAVIIINEYQQIVEWNPKAETIFGFSKIEIAGKTLAETIIPPQYREAHINGMHHFLSTGEGPVLNKTIEITALHKNGQEFYVGLSISNLLLNDRWLFIAFLSDISERKKTEEALIKKEAELLQSKLLEEKKDEFLSIASHELRTPITTVKAYAEIALIKCKDCGDEVIMYLNKVIQHINKLTFLLNELLDLSKINKGKLELYYTETNIDNFLNEVFNSIQLITKDHKIVFDKNANVIIRIDRIRIEQVVVNLISNASKYSPGKDKIIVKSEIKNGSVIVSFKDYGIGIHSSDLTNVFKRFYRVNSSSVPVSGLGVGLFISSEIITQHGGKMWAQSIEGKGSIFCFSLPAI